MLMILISRKVERRLLVYYDYNLYLRAKQINEIFPLLSVFFFSV